MRLLLITNCFPNPYYPTKGTFNLELARALAREHEVLVISPMPWIEELRGSCRRNGGLDRRRRVVMDGIEVHYPRYYYPPKMLRRLYGWFLWQSVAGTVQHLLKSRMPDAVLGYWAHPDGEVAVRAARLAGAPSLVMVGGSDVLMLAQRENRRRSVLKVLRATDAVVTVSGALRTKLIESGIRSEKLHVVYRGVNTDLFSPGDQVEARRRLGIPLQGRILLWVGRMVPVKGLDVLVKACAGLWRSRTDFHLYLVGDGPLRRSLESQIRAVGLSGTITFVGPVLQNRLPDWYRAADLTVLPSWSEGIPNVLRESLACGTRFVATRVGGIPEIADESLDQLVEPGHPRELAETIGRVLERRSSAAVAQVQPTGWSESAESLVRLIHGLISGSLDQHARSYANSSGRELSTQIPGIQGRGIEMRQ